ncbi:hypothetical protein BBJ29_001271 [Phytophthora kernoviae]|uniref:Necrosis inducing-like protein NPP1 type n=1 Tax=Phytophthora kernoviae TaxID=325452 RepID=A0A3F2RTG5_9STRA|nr:hypothetical protein BBJ29_001271 [Phytophthora kernoviae]RLN63844.1 hypothetical protein BBP00_00003839 [Phytophthora kernoviae]
MSSIISTGTFGKAYSASAGKPAVRFSLSHFDPRSESIHFIKTTALMNVYGLFLAAVAALTAVHAQSNIIGHNLVRPFAQPEPVTISEKVAVKFKPQLKISDGCHPYPAVQKDGAVSGGLKWSGPQDGECGGSALGSQVYARSTWVNDVWAIMYAWYFPKGRAAVPPSLLLRLFGHRHNWEYAIVWIDNPDNENATVLGLSMSASVGYANQVPPEARYLSDSSVKIDYYYNLLVGNTALRSTEDAGEFQDLIQWDQLSDLGRKALNNTDWDETPLNAANVKMPLKDGVFRKTLDQAWPF